ncbi:hypothetical protein Q5530_30185 [Saccharothrix sp. BKS2]|uniref:hypothetical protein n=1 Tax=Saccharothrix sp. BKS2 TaxID=3064400 RepID=UPI0039ED4449
MSGDDSALAGFRGVTTGLVDELVKRPGGRARTLPLVVALGSRGTGKTALLGRVRDRCADGVPLALLDFEDPAGVRRPGAALAGIALDLGRDVPGADRIAFPRLWLCALVLAGDPGDRDGALAELRDLMSEDHLLERHRPRVLELVRLVGEPDGLPGWAPSATGVLLHGLDWFSRRRLLRAVRQVTRGAPRDPRDLPAALDRVDRGSPADRRAVDNTLFDAFLADLHRHFTGRADHPRRSARCAVLLDNVHTGEGKAFLTSYLAARERSAAVGDHVAVIATSRTWNTDWDDAWRRPGTPAGGTAPLPLPRTPEDAERDARSATEWRPWYLVHPGHLNAADTEDVVVRAAVPGLPRSLPHRLTRGHPGGLRIVLDVPAGRESPVAPRRLLSARASPAGNASLADEALAQLLRDLPAERVEDLVTASAGRGVEFLPDPTAPDAGPPDGGDELHAFLLDHFLLTLEPDENGPRVVLDPWLRTLLLHRLAHREDPARGWDAVHRRYRDHHEARGRTTEARYHDLALGDVRSVVAHLAGPFTSDGPLDQPTARGWLRELDLITGAPNRLPRDHDPLTQVELLAEGVPPTGPHGAALARLVAALWIAGDPLGDPEDTLRGRVEHAYSRLSQHSGQGSILLYDRVERYRA